MPLPLMDSVFCRCPEFPVQKQEREAKAVPNNRDSISGAFNALDVSGSASWHTGTQTLHFGSRVIRAMLYETTV